MTHGALRSAVLLLAGAAILASALLHGFVNVPHLHEDLVELGVRPTLLRAILLVLAFSVVAMMAFGALVLHGAWARLRGRPGASGSLWIVAALYAAFGVIGWALVSPTPHMLGYTAMGLLVALAELPWRRPVP